MAPMDPTCCIGGAGGLFPGGPGHGRKPAGIPDLLAPSRMAGLGLGGICDDYVSPRGAYLCSRGVYMGMKPKRAPFFP